MRHTVSLFLAASILLSGCSATTPNQPSERPEQSVKTLELSGTRQTVEETPVYAEASHQSRVLETLPAGARISIETAAHDPAWASVVTGAGQGWINTANLAAGSHASTVKLPTVYKAKAKSPLRAAASDKSRNLRTLSTGTLVDKTASKGSWVKTKVGSSTGWIHARTLTMQAHTKYTLNSKQTLTSKAGSGRTLATIAKGATVTHTGRTSGKHYQVGYRNRLGWLKSSTISRVYVEKFRVKAFTSAHSTAGGKTMSTLYKGQVLGSYSRTTKKIKGITWVQLRVGNQNGWVLQSKVNNIAVGTALGSPTAITAKYAARKGTVLRTSPNGKAVATVAAGHVIGTTSKDTVRSAGKTWIHVTQGGKQLWIEASHWALTSLSKPLGAPKPALSPNPAPTPFNQALASKTKTDWTDAQYIAAIKQNIAPWCPTVPVKLAKTEGSYYATSHPLEIYISRIGNPNPNWGNIYSVSLHECAHIKQFSAYSNKLQDLDRDMDPLWGVKGMGIEYLADCMSDLMGGKRQGVLPNGWTYWSGYGKTCNSAQNKAAQTLLNGKTLS